VAFPALRCLLTEDLILHPPEADRLCSALRVRDSAGHRLDVLTLECSMWVDAGTAEFFMKPKRVDRLFRNMSGLVQEARMSNWTDR
jgi:hypothetical protein